MRVMGKKNFLALLVALTIPLNLTGCGDKKDKEKAYNDFVKTMATVMPLYKFPDLNLSDEELNSILEVAETTKECKSTDVDYTNLHLMIIKNSILYSMAENRIFVDYNDLSKYDETEIERDKLMRTALERALSDILTTSSDVNEDICHLKNLVVINENLQQGISREDLNLETLSFAAYSPEDNTLIVDFEALEFGYRELKQRGLDNGITFDFYITLNIKHELDHARAYICDCRKEAGQKYQSFNYKQTLMSITEASAESQLYGNDLEMLKNNRNLFVYGVERYQEALLLLLASFKDNRDISSYYGALNNTDLKGLYEFFGLNTKDDYRMFYDITRTMDSISGNNAVSYFLDSNGYTTCESKEDTLGYTYKINIFKTALNDLISYQNKYGDLSLEDLVFIYNFIKSYVVTGTYEAVGSECIYLVFDEEFLKDFLAIESCFYEYLETYFGISESKVSSIDIMSYFEELKEGQGSQIDKLLGKFPLLQFIYTTIPLNIVGLKDYTNDAESILARK